MPEREPQTQTVNASAARQHWSQLLSQVFREQTRVIVEKSGIPVAAIISTEDLARLTRLEGERAARFAILDEIGAAFQNVPDDEIEREVAQAVASARVRTRAATSAATEA